MADAAPKIEPEITLGSLVSDALQEVDGNTEKAINRVLSQLKHDPKLLRRVVQAAIGLAVFHRTQQQIRGQRGNIIRHVTANNQPSRANVVALAQGIRACLLDIPLAGGKRLRDSTREGVLEQVDRYEKQAGDMSHKARWLRLIAQSLPAGKLVGEVVSEERAVELFEQTRTKTDTTA